MKPGNRAIRKGWGKPPELARMPETPKTLKPKTGKPETPKGGKPEIGKTSKPEILKRASDAGATACGLAHTEYEISGGVGGIFPQETIYAMAVNARGG